MSWLFVIKWEALRKVCGLCRKNVAGLFKNSQWRLLMFMLCCFVLFVWFACVFVYMCVCLFVCLCLLVCVCVFLCCLFVCMAVACLVAWLLRRVV